MIGRIRLLNSQLPRTFVPEPSPADGREFPADAGPLLTRGSKVLLARIFRSRVLPIECVELTGALYWPSENFSRQQLERSASHATSEFRGISVTATRKL